MTGQTGSSRKRSRIHLMLWVILASLFVWTVASSPSLGPDRYEMTSVRPAQWHAGQIILGGALLLTPLEAELLLRN